MQLSPSLYLIHDEAMIRQSTDNLVIGISVAGRIINIMTREWWLTVRKGYNYN